MFAWTCFTFRFIPLGTRQLLWKLNCNPKEYRVPFRMEVPGVSTFRWQHITGILKDRTTFPATTCCEPLDLILCCLVTHVKPSMCELLLWTWQEKSPNPYNIWSQSFLPLFIGIDAWLALEHWQIQPIHLDKLFVLRNIKIIPFYWVTGFLKVNF